MPTEIQWCDETWNCVRGCSRVSSGCGDSTGGGCYAERQAYRFSGPGMPYEGLVRMTPKGPRWTGKVILVEEKLNEPLKWRKPRRIFVNSMSDLFHEALSDNDILRVFDVMRRCPQHTFQILTKRPERMKDFSQRLRFNGEGAGRMWLAENAAANERGYRLMGGNGATGMPWVWVGVSVEDQKTADERIPLLLQTPAAVRWISYEPALGPIDLSRGNMIGGAECYCGDFVVGDHGQFGAEPCRMCRCKGVRMPWTRDANRRIDWCVVGGESGPKARPFDIVWARSIVEQCRAANVPVFVKQIGAYPISQQKEQRPWEPLFNDAYGRQPTGEYGVALKDKKGGRPEEWPADLRVREFPAGVTAK